MGWLKDKGEAVNNFLTKVKEWVQVIVIFGVLLWIFSYLNGATAALGCLIVLCCFLLAIQVKNQVGYLHIEINSVNVEICRLQIELRALLMRLEELEDGSPRKRINIR